MKCSITKKTTQVASNQTANSTNVPLCKTNLDAEVANRTNSKQKKSTKKTQECLALRARFGEEKAFSDLVKMHQADIRRLFFNMVDGNEELSKDLTQETFKKAWLNIGKFQGKAKFRTWLDPIAKNIFRDYLRSKDNKKTKLTSRFGVDLDVEKYRHPEKHEDKHCPSSNIDADYLKKNIQLINNQRYKYIIDKLSNDAGDIDFCLLAEEVGVPVDNVYTLKMRAVKQFGTILKKNGYNIPPEITNKVNFEFKKASQTNKVKCLKIKEKGRKEAYLCMNGDIIYL
ncbi:MAG: sigma-70 family RNA polymerase sigma factor [Lentimicrobiaceae bacterium]|nr:sigma-70 family RNA polymerase sigma factor [Lentimicrobiaceae bacterium]